VIGGESAWDVFFEFKAVCYGIRSSVWNISIELVV